MKVLTSVCGFYGMVLIAGLMIITVIVYGPMELELDVDGMAANWRMRRFWRKLIVPFCVFMVNNLVIPIVFVSSPFCGSLHILCSSSRFLV